MDAGRLERLMEQVLSEVGDLRRTVTDGFYEINARMDRLEARMDGLEARMDGLEARMDGLEVRIDGLEVRIDGLARDVKLTQLAVLETASEVRRVGVKVDDHEARLNHLERAAQ